MNVDGLFWMILPLMGALCIAVMVPNVRRNRKSTLMGFIITAAIVGGYLVWRFTQGGL